MPKEGKKAVVLDSILENIQSMKKEQEWYFTEIQSEIQNIRQELKNLRAEANGFHKGFGAKSGRQDVFNYKLIGILEDQKMLAPQQAAELRCV